MSQHESPRGKRSHSHSLSHDQHKWSHSVMLVMLGHKDLVESCDVRAHDTREWDLVTAPRGRVADKRSSSRFLVTWATTGKFHRF